MLTIIDGEPLKARLLLRGSTVFHLSSGIKKSPCTALNPYLHVRFEITVTFSTVLHAHLMYKSIAKDCKKICMAHF